MLFHKLFSCDKYDYPAHRIHIPIKYYVVALEILEFLCCWCHMIEIVVVVLMIPTLIIGQYYPSRRILKYLF